MKKVSVVIVTFNRLRLLKMCLIHLLNQSYPLDHIFIINNNSSDGTDTYLSKLNNPLIISRTLNKNVGGAGGFSLGTKLAYEHSSSNYFWLMDDDTMPTKDSLRKLIYASNVLNNHFGFLCSNVRLSFNNAPSNVPQVTKDWTRDLNKNLVKVKSATFVSLFFTRKSVKKLGLPIGEMFIWGDDTEYTTRLSRNCESYLVPDSIVIHKTSPGRPKENIFNSPEGKIFFYKCMSRNILYISRKYYTFSRVIKMIFVYLSDIVKIPFKAKDHRMKRILSVLLGIILGLYFNPKIRYPK